MLLLRILGGQLSFQGFDMLFGMATLGFGMDCMVSWVVKLEMVVFPATLLVHSSPKIKIGVYSYICCSLLHGWNKVPLLLAFSRSSQRRMIHR